MCQRLFAEGTDTQARQGDAELHRGDEPRRVGDDSPHGAGAPVALIGQLLDPRPPRGHERVLARDEEGVQQDQRRDAEELEEKGHVPAAAGVGLSGSSSKGLA